MRVLMCIAVGLIAVPATAQVSGGAAAPQVQSGASSRSGIEGDDRVVCRVQSETGSWVRQRRVCKTVAQWRRVTEAQNDTARGIVEDNRARPGGNF